MSAPDRNPAHSGEHPAAVPPRDTGGCVAGVLLAFALLGLVAIVVVSALVALRSAP